MGNSWHMTAVDFARLARAVPKQPKVGASLTILPAELKLKVIKLVLAEDEQEEEEQAALPIFFWDGADAALPSPLDTYQEKVPGWQFRWLSGVDRTFYTLCASIWWKEVDIVEPADFLRRPPPVIQPAALQSYIRHLRVDYYQTVGRSKEQSQLNRIIRRLPSLSSLSISIPRDGVPLPFSSTITKLRLKLQTGDASISRYLSLFSSTLEVLILNVSHMRVTPSLLRGSVTLPRLTHLAFDMAVTSEDVLSAFAACPIQHFSLTSCTTKLLPALLVFLKSHQRTLKTFRYVYPHWVEMGEASQALNDIAALEKWCAEKDVRVKLPELSYD